MDVKEYLIGAVEYLFPDKAVVPMTHKAKEYEPTAAATYRTLFTDSFNGEKNLGEIGPVKMYALDYCILRARSWQAYLESGVTQTVLRKFTLWMVGAGLKLQCEPSKKFFATEGIDFDVHKFSEQVEARWQVFAKSKCADFANMVTLNKVQQRAYLNSIIGGDVLVLLRVINGQVKVQLVDGEHVQSPGYGSDAWPQDLPNGNQLKNGIETDPTGEHIAYYVRNDKYEYERIPARNSTGLIMAYMVFGLEYRLDNNRGVPLITTVMEKLAKMNRYEEATIGSAEERQKIAYFFEHGTQSTGDSAIMKQMAKARNVDSNSDQLPVDISGNALADLVAATTNKMTFNLTPDSTVKMLDSKNELYFKDFFGVNIDIICACIGIPPNVAMSKYDDSFSASRAALKDWEHVLNVGRVDFSSQFLQPIYNLWLEVEILKNKIQAPGYLLAKVNGNEMLMSAYRTARFVGPNVPHIDPLKEVKAEREKLGASGADLPLTTLEAATESLNGGESYNNLEQYAAELQQAKDLKIITPEPIQVPPGKD
ncbi:MAG: phage portal protein [Cytophagaceae bacterium]|nr:phage portal protein [Cytophagaceae bacterium]